MYHINDMPHYHEIVMYCESSRSDGYSFKVLNIKMYIFDTTTFINNCFQISQHFTIEYFTLLIIKK